MSDEKSQQQEPTMEEILASIRRIISENDDGEARTTAPRAKEAPRGIPSADPEEGRQVSAPAASRPEEDVLELTDVVEEPRRSEPASDPVRDDLVIEDVPVGRDEPAIPLGPPAKTMDDPEEARPAPLPARPAPADALVSDATEAASTAALAQLAHALDRDPRSIGNIGLGSGNTLEDLVKDMIRPMLREWLDRNLAPLVERMVRREIERMVRRAEDDT